MKIKYFSETIADYDLKVSGYNSTKWVNEATLVSEVKVILCFQNCNLLLSEMVKSFETKFSMQAYGSKGIKIYTNKLVHVTKMAATHIHG